MLLNSLRFCFWLSVSYYFLLIGFVHNFKIKIDVVKNGFQNIENGKWYITNSHYELVFLLMATNVYLIGLCNHFVKNLKLRPKIQTILFPVPHTHSIYAAIFLCYICFLQFSSKTLLKKNLRDIPSLGNDTGNNHVFF